MKSNQKYQASETPPTHFNEGTKCLLNILSDRQKPRLVVAAEYPSFPPPALDQGLSLYEISQSSRRDRSSFSSSVVELPKCTYLAGRVPSLEGELDAVRETMLFPLRLLKRLSPLDEEEAVERKEALDREEAVVEVLDDDEEELTSSRERFVRGRRGADESLSILGRRVSKMARIIRISRVRAKT